MDQLQLLALIVTILAALLTIIAYLTGFGGWVIRKLHRLFKPEYEYCFTIAQKDRGTFFGYFLVVTAEGTRLPYREERYSILRDISFGVDPKPEVGQHMDAFNRLVKKLEDDGWRFVDLPDLTVWYRRRFRRPTKR